MKKIRIATRKSPLALWQTNHVARLLSRQHSDLKIELVEMTTRGDKILDSPLNLIGGKGLFVKELELGLLENKADIAVHSMKDVPMDLLETLHLPVILERDDPRDAFVSNHCASPEQLPATAIIGTSSLRRRAQLKARYPQFDIRDLRGNVGTRLAKLDKGEYDAIILAAAGLKRLGLENRISCALDPRDSLPAIGQAAIGIECRQNDPAIESLIQSLNHPDTAICIKAERAFNRRLHGGCHMPAAAYAQLECGGQLRMRGLLAQPDGSHTIQSTITGPATQAEILGRTLAEQILQQGGNAILTALGVAITPHT